MRITWIAKHFINKCLAKKRTLVWVLIGMCISFVCVLVVFSAMTFQRLNSPWYLSRLKYFRFDKPISAQVVTDVIKNVGLDPVNGFALIADVDHANGVGFTGMYGTLWAPITEAGPIMRDSAGSEDDIFRLELDIVPLEYIRDLKN